MKHEPLLLFITPEMKRLGYYEKIGCFVYARQYNVIRELPNGQFVVIAPEQGAQSPPINPNQP